MSTLNYPELPSLSVWIVNYESAIHLSACIAGLNSPAIRSILILDNNSSDSDLQILRNVAAKDDRVHLVESSTNMGFGGGHNALSNVAPENTGDFIWILNPDMTIPEGVVDRLVQTLLLESVEIVSPVIVTGDAPQQRLWFSGGTIDVRRGQVNDALLGRDLAGLRGQPAVVSSEFISGAAPMMSRRVWDRIGGFDAKLFLYWEDVDLCLRAKALSIRMGVQTNAIIWHAEGGSSKGNRTTRTDVYFLTSRNRILVCRKSALHGWLLIFGPGTPALLKILVHAMLREGPGRVARTFSVIRGSLAGASAPMRRP